MRRHVCVACIPEGLSEGSRQGNHFDWRNGDDGILEEYVVSVVDGAVAREELLWYRV